MLVALVLFQTDLPASHLPGNSNASTSLAFTYRPGLSVVQSFNSNAGDRNWPACTPFSYDLDLLH